MANEKRLISVDDCPCDGCKAKPCGHPARCVKFTLWLNKTVDAVEAVHARWEWLGPNRLIPECMCGTCSNCKVRTKYIVNTELCPNCGAKMDGDGND